MDTYVRLRGKLAIEAWDPHTGVISTPQYTYVTEAGYDVTRVKLDLQENKSIFIVGTRNQTATELNPGIRQGITLLNNFPNPFSQVTMIRFDVAGNKEPVRLCIYDIKGELVRELTNRPLLSGNHKAIWDGLDYSGTQTPAGIYFYCLKVGEFKVITRKLVRI